MIARALLATLCRGVVCLLRQFQSVGVFFIALMLLGKNFFEPLCLPFRNPLIHRRRIVPYEELLATTVTPQCAHLLETHRFLPATLLYRHRPHLCSYWLGGQLTALMAEAFKIWSLGVRCVTTLVADKQTTPAR